MTGVSQIVEAALTINGKPYDSKQDYLVTMDGRVGVITSVQQDDHATDCICAAFDDAHDPYTSIFGPTDDRVQKIVLGTGEEITAQQYLQRRTPAVQAAAAA